VQLDGCLPFMPCSSSSSSNSRAWGGWACMAAAGAGCSRDAGRTRWATAQYHIRGGAYHASGRSRVFQGASGCLRVPQGVSKSFDRPYFLLSFPKIREVHCALSGLQPGCSQGACRCLCCDRVLPLLLTCSAPHYQPHTVCCRIRHHVCCLCRVPRRPDHPPLSADPSAHTVLPVS
jgi:hypothetical protein